MSPASEAPTPEPVADSGGDTSSGQSAPPIAADPTPEPVSAPPSGDTAPDVLGDLAADQAVFDRGYVESIRAEGARYRTQARDLEQQFADRKDVLAEYDQFTPDDQQAWTQLMGEFRTDPVSAASRFQAVSEAILAEHGVDPNTATPEQRAAADAAAAGELTPDGVDPATLTPEKVSELVAQELANRDQEANRKVEVDGVFAKLREAGFDARSDDPQQAGAGFLALWYTNNHADGDLAAGVKFVADMKQAAVDDYVNGIKNGTRATPAPDGTPSNQHNEVTSWEDARKRTTAMLAARNDPGST